MIVSEFLEYPLSLHHADLGPAVVQNAREERAYRAKGYEAAGKSDAEAFARAQAGTSPDYKPNPYPKWVGDRIANDADEERALLSAAPNG